MRRNASWNTYWAQVGTALLVWLLMGTGTADGAEAGLADALALRGRFEGLQEQLARNQFQRPLYLVSGDTSSSVSGNIYAVVNTSFATVGTALSSPARWCDILMLHINTKYCRAALSGGGSVLQVNIGRKSDQPLDESFRLDFAYRIVAESPGYLKVTLSADTGPLSTRDHRVILEAIPLDSGGTFLHFTYSYGYGIAGQLAMQSYLATIGRDKVGFTVVGTQAGGGTLYIGGVRGVAERNAMRYFLAIEAFLGATSAPPKARLEQSLRDWYAAAERYPRQLHEMEQHEYLDMKRREHLRL